MNVLAQGLPTLGNITDRPRSLCFTEAPLPCSA